MRKFLFLVCCVAACGDDGVRHTPDATPSDGRVTPDSPIDAAPSPVTITTSVDGAPMTGVHVYFINADGSVVLATTTDATGAASAVMNAGGSVTAVDPYPPLPSATNGPDQLYTVIGVKPGDHLKLATTQAFNEIQVTVTAASDVGATSYTAYSPCANQGQQLSGPPQSFVQPPESSIMYLDNCGSATNFLVTAEGSAMDFFYAPNVPVADQGSADLTASTYAPATVRTYTFTNAPAQMSLALEDDLLDAAGVIYKIFNETPSDTQITTANVPLFAGANDVMQTSFGGSDGFADHVLLDWGQFGSAFTTDVAARALYDYSSQPVFDAGTHAASIGEDTGTGGAPDFSAFFMSAQRTADGHSWSWNVVAPYAASVTLPTLPTDIYDFNIGSGDTTNVNAWITGKVPGGYDVIRSVLLSINGPQDLAIGGTGAASFVLYPDQRGVRARTSLRHRWLQASDTFRPAPRVLRHRTR